MYCASFFELQSLQKQHGLVAPAVRATSAQDWASKQRLNISRMFFMVVQTAADAFLDLRQILHEARLAGDDSGFGDYRFLFCEQRLGEGCSQDQ